MPLISRQPRRVVHDGRGIVGARHEGAGTTGGARSERPAVVTAVGPCRGNGGGRTQNDRDGGTKLHVDGARPVRYWGCRTDSTTGAGVWLDELSTATSQTPAGPSKPVKCFVASLVSTAPARSTAEAAAGTIT